MSHAKSPQTKPDTADLVSRRRHLLGAGAPLFYDEPLHFVSGKGVWLEAANGRRYLDVYNNVPNVGHCHPHVLQALHQQAGKLNVHTRYLDETILAYGENLTARLDDSLSMLFLTCSGSEANDLALRMARLNTGRQGIICSNMTYHGNTAAVDELATLFNDGQPGGPTVKAVDFPCQYRPLDDLSGDALLRAHTDQVRNAIAEFEAEGIGFAGLLFCPIFANEGLPEPPTAYLESIATIVRQAGGVLIFDEVQSAFGRTGHMWGHEVSGVVPDIMTLGKPMGNGHPVAGLVCTAQLGNGLRDQVMYFNTFGGNPVSCAVGQAVLEVMDKEDLINNARQVSTYLRSGLGTLALKREFIGDIRHQGLFFGVELVEDRRSKTPATQMAHDVVNLMAKNGVLISSIGRDSNILKMRPPLCFSSEDADLLLETLGEVLSHV